MLLAKTLLSLSIKTRLSAALFMKISHARSHTHNTLQEARVLSLQSHTVHGYVGNKAATFPLQLLGLDVDPLNTVHFSTHSRYGNLRGESTTSEQVDTLIEGLKLNSVFDYDYVLSGYARSSELLERVAGIVNDLRSSQKPNLQYFLNPVLGDETRGFYVPADLVETYRSLMIPLANVITPNRFEAEVLTGMKVRSLKDAVEACEVLHSMGPEVVVLTSLDHDDDDDGLKVKGTISVIASTVIKNTSNNKENKIHAYHIQLPKLSGRFTGCGDLFMACLLGNMHRHSNDFPTAFEHSCASVHSILHRTAKHKIDGELRLVQSRDDIVRPEVRFPAEAFPTETSPITGIIFDMDGTLTYPGSIDFALMRRRIGIPPGHDILSDIKRLLPVESQPSAVRVVEEEEAKGLDRMKLMPGLVEVVQQLKRKRIKCAIATRNVKAGVDRFMELGHFTEHHFDPILTRDFAHNKPDPKVAEHVANVAWGCETERIAFVGDHRDDMLCGKSAGCVTVFCNYPQGDESEENSRLCQQKEYADFVIEDLNQLLDVLKI